MKGAREGSLGAGGEQDRAVQHTDPKGSGWGGTGRGRAPMGSKSRSFSSLQAQHPAPGAEKGT